MRNRVLRGAIIGCVVCICVFVLHMFDVFQTLEWKSWDLRMRLFSDPTLASTDIVLFLIDQQSLDVYEQEQGLAWPWPRHRPQRVRGAVPAPASPAERTGWGP